MNILLMIIIILAAGGISYILYKKNKLDKTVEYLVKLLEIYGKHVLNKVKLVLLINLNGKNQKQQFMKMVKHLYNGQILLIARLHLRLNNQSQMVLQTNLRKWDFSPIFFSLLKVRFFNLTFFYYIKFISSNI